MGWTDVDFWALVFLLSEWAIRLVMLAVVPVRRTPTAAKSWLLLMLFEPWIGLVLYLLIEPDGPVFAEPMVRVLAARDIMLEATDTEYVRWNIVPSDD